MSDDLATLEAELGDRLRYTLTTVADTAHVSAAPEVTRRRWGRLAGLAAVAVGAAAFAAQNDDAIVRLPVEEALMSGEADSGEWHLLPTDAVVTPDPACEGESAHTSGVVLVAERMNRPGQELNAGGVAYGEWPESASPCAPLDQSAWLKVPGRSEFGHSKLGPEESGAAWGVYGTVHPSVTAVRVTVDDTDPVLLETVARADQPDGPRYVAFDVPADAARAVIELLDESGDVVPADPETSENLIREFG